MTGKKMLIIALILNLAFLGFYISVNPISAAEEDKVEPAALQQPVEAVQTPQEQWEMIKQRNEELTIREQELKELEKQVDEKIRRLQALEASI